MKERPFGFWDSPVQPHHLTQAIHLTDVAWDNEDLLWLEGRGGKGVVVHCNQNGKRKDLTDGFNVRARLNYGGGDFAIHNGKLFFVDHSGQRFALSSDAGEATPITSTVGLRAAPTVSNDGRWVVFVHRNFDVDQLVMVDADGKCQPRILASGADFYLHPSIHPDNQYVSWIEWDHPDMPWDGTRLVVAKLQDKDGQLPCVVETTTVAGTKQVSVVQPQFSPDGRHLAYISDLNGWSNLYLYNLESGSHKCIVSSDGEVAEPAWVHGQRFYVFSTDNNYIYYTESRLGVRRLWRFNCFSSEISLVKEFSEFSQVQQIAVNPKGLLAAIVCSSQTPPQIVTSENGNLTVKTNSISAAPNAKALSVPESIFWTTSNGQKIHGLYYSPFSTTFCCSGPPPLLVHIHGGPTGQATVSFEEELQYFATRGYGVLSVNHRGSSGYGRNYRQCLRGNWGIYDLEDVADGVRTLVSQGLADINLLGIKGSSAGGYTVLRSLTCHPGLFRAALSRYGISDLLALAQATHKFELHYLDSLLGPLPKSKELYRERSPLSSVDAITDAVALFQGADDEVVPKEQSDAIVESLRKRSIPFEYHIYKGEGHGFRNPNTIENYIKTAEAFLREHLLNNA